MAETLRMPSLRQQVSARPLLAVQLKRLFEQIEKSERHGLAKSLRVGRLLKDVPPAERLAVIREAGLPDPEKKNRTAQVYIRIAKNWPEIKKCLAQRAAPPSIRAADRCIRRPKESGRLAQSPLPQRDVPLPIDDLGCVVLKHRPIMLTPSSKQKRVGWCRDDPRVSPDVEHCPSCKRRIEK